MRNQITQLLLAAPLLTTLLLALLTTPPLSAAVQVTDDMGNRITLERPAERIISLAPHITENLFSAGAGDQLIGTVNFSDYPQQAQAVTQVGGYHNIDIEKIVSLRPDIVIAWREGNQRNQVEKLAALGIAVYVNAPALLEDIAGDIRRFGILAGSEQTANAKADYFLRQLARLKENHAARDKVSVFYQVWHMPLISVNDEQIIGRIIELCGGNNIFAGLAALTPMISMETVIAADPQAIIASGMGEARPEWLDDWREWRHLQAVQQDNLFFIQPDIIQRYTLRILIGARQLCAQLDTVRQQ